MTDSRYITNQEWRRQRTRLTRAINAGKPLGVLAAVERTLEEWQGKTWPDEWSRWERALDDAFWTLQRAGDIDAGTLERFARAREVLQ